MNITYNDEGIPVMTPELATAWAERLESNQDPQTVGVLFRVNDDRTRFDESDIDASGRKRGYCCLGVLGEVLVEAGVMEREALDGSCTRVSLDDPRAYNHSFNLIGNQAITPYEVVNGSMGDAMISGASSDFVNANDSQRKTFPEIAQMVRDRFLKEDA